MKKRSLRPKEWIALTICLCVWIFCGWKYLVYQPMQGQIDKKRESYISLYEERIKVQNFMNGHLDLEKSGEEQKKRRTSLEKLLPDRMEQGTFISDLERRAIADHLVLLEVKPGEVEKMDGGVLSLPISIRLRGDYFSLVDFMEQMEDVRQTGRFTEIHKIDVKAEKDELLCDLKISIYAVPPQ